MTMKKQHSQNLGYAAKAVKFLERYKLPKLTQEETENCIGL